MSESNLRALIDANVFVNVLALDFILRYAEIEPELAPFYSSEIEGEVRKVLGSGLKNPWEPIHIDGFFEAIESTFPGAKIDNYYHLIESCPVPESDQHVLAAARHAEATHLVTFNLRDFPASTLSQFDILPIHPDEFITLLCRRQDQLGEAIFSAMAEKRRIDLSALSARLEKHLPETSKVARQFSGPD